VTEFTKTLAAAIAELHSYRCPLCGRTPYTELIGTKLIFEESYTLHVRVRHFEGCKYATVAP
jgi:hypothetical protein